MRTLFTLILLNFSIVCLAQDQAKLTNGELAYKYSLSGQLEYGFLIGHHPEMERLSTRHFPSFRIYAGRKTAGSRAWHQHYNFPELGVGLFHSQLMGTDQLGAATALFVYYEKNMGKRQHNAFSFRFGFGPGFLSSKFDRIDNNQNIAIGTHLNIFFMMEFQKAWRLSEHLDLKAGIGISHFSNTGSQMPNLGINLASAQLALRYCFEEQELNTEKIDTYPDQWEHEIMLSYGRKQADVNYVISNIINFRYQAIYTLSFKSGLIGSADTFTELAEDSPYEALQQEDYFQAGIAAGYLLNMEQFQVSLQWGFYLYNKNPDFEAYYHRINVKWIANEHLLVNLGLRTEWARARNVELGLGWRF